MMKQKNNKQLEEWLVEFKGENTSLFYDLNFLWKKNNVYIMDNHRAAMWCWLQEIVLEQKYDLFHIDRHYDTLYSNIKSWLDTIPDLKPLKLEEYLNLKEKDGKTPTIQYGNYLSIFLERHSSYLDACWFSTYNEGDKPRWKNMQSPQPKSLPSSFGYWLNKSQRQWIVNLDIDTFFCDDNKDGQMRLHSDSFIKSLGKSLKDQNDRGKIKVITIALSPEWSGGWEKAKKACSILTNAMDIDFDLPTV